MCAIGFGAHSGEGLHRVLQTKEAFCLHVNLTCCMVIPKVRVPVCRGVIASALSPFRDALVVGTVRGSVFAISMADEQYSITQCAKLEAPISHICWNGGTGEVYASAAAQVAVLRQR